MAAIDSTAPLPDVAVVTVSYGSQDVLPAFLDSLPEASARKLAVLVVDNKPDQSGPVSTLSLSAGAQYLPRASNLGYGGAINAAVSTLPPSVKWILVSNPDVSLGRLSIDVLVKAGDESEQIGAVGPAILTAEGSIYPSARIIPSLRNGVGHALFAKAWPANPWSRNYYSDSGASERRDAGWLSGACLLVRRSVFDELGGFDSGYFMYFEDVDLGFRIGEAGYRNVYEPGATVVHTGAHSTAEDSAAMVKAHHDSARRFLNKKYSARWLWPLRAALGLGLRLRSALLRRSLKH